MFKTYFYEFVVFDTLGVKSLGSTRYNNDLNPIMYLSNRLWA